MQKNRNVFKPNTKTFKFGPAFDEILVLFKEKKSKLLQNKFRSFVC